MSLSSSGPTGCRYARTAARSMSVADATPSSSMRMASSAALISRRDVAKPGMSVTVMLCLPSASTADRAAASVSGSVAAPAMSSTSGSDHTGLKKCMPKKRPGSESDEASESIEMELVLVASVVGRRCSIRWSTLVLSARSSGTDSMTKSAASGKRSISPTGWMRARANAASSGVILLRLTAPASAPSAAAHKTATCAVDGSTTVTWLPATANT